MSFIILRELPPVNVEQLSKLTLSSGPLKDLKKNLTPIPTTVPSPADQSMSDLSEMRSELNSVSCVEDSTGYSSGKISLSLLK